MRLKNVLITVENLERSKKFYKDLFGLDVILEKEGNAILTEGLVLQDKNVWKSVVGGNVLHKNTASVLYFEEKEIEKFAERLGAYEMPVEYIGSLVQHPWGRKTIRFYDPDGNLIEVGTPG